MTQAIETRYFGPVSVRGARIIAKAAAGGVVIPYDHALSLDGNHVAAARALRDKFGWRGEWISGVLASGVYVFVDISGPTHLGFH